jgi:hypothetical protein
MLYINIINIFYIINYYYKRILYINIKFIIMTLNNKFILRRLHKTHFIRS